MSGADDGAAPPPAIPLPGRFFSGGDDEFTSAEGASLNAMIQAELAATGMQITMISSSIAALVGEPRRNYTHVEQVPPHANNHAMFQFMAGANYTVTFEPARGRIHIDMLHGPRIPNDEWNFPDDEIVAPASFWTQLRDIFPHKELWPTQAGAVVHWWFKPGPPIDELEWRIDDTTFDGMDSAFADLSL